MAHTLHPDPALQRFNAAKEKLGHYFRFRPQSAFFNLIAMGAVPAGLFYFAYSMEGLSLSRAFRTDVVLEEEYVPRKKDL